MLPTASSSNTVSSLIGEVKAIRQFCQQGITTTAAGPTSANQILGLCQRLNAGVVNILTPAMNNAPSMAELARVLGLADGSAAATEVQGVIDAINSAITWVFNNFPKQNSGGVDYILKDTLNADGSVNVRSFTAAQTAGLRTQLQTVLDAIEQ